MADDALGAQELLAPDSALPEIRHGKQVWTVGRPDQDARARLERLAKKVALDEVRDLKDVLDPAAYREAFDAVTRDLKSYRTWGEGWQKTVLSPEGAHLFLWSLLQAKHPDVTEPQVKQLAAECPEEVQAALAQVVPDFFHRLLLDLVNRAPADQRAGVRAVAEKVLAEVRQQLTPSAAKS